MKYTMDRRGIGKMMKVDPGLHRRLHEVARTRLAISRRRAPRDDGELARSGRVEDLGIQPVFKGERRMTVAVVFHAPYAAIQQRRTGFMNAALGKQVADPPDLPGGGR